MSNNLNEARFIGGHYDSVKQSSVYGLTYADMYEDSELSDKAFYNKLKIRMMIDMLFCKVFVLTYSQLLDGIYFHHLFRNYYEDNFINALKNDLKNISKGKKPLLEIRIWPNDNNIGNTFSKRLLANNEFHFSSLEALKPGLSNEFRKFTSNYFKGKVNVIYNNQNFLNEIEKSFGQDDENHYIKNWLQDFELMCNIPNEYVTNWNKDFSSCMRLVKKTSGDHINELKKYLQNRTTKSRNIENMDLLKTFLARLEDNTRFPDRSKFMGDLKEMKFDNVINNRFMRYYNDLYYKTISLQHECHLCDVGIDNRVMNDDDDIVGILTQNTKQSMAVLDWVSYFRILRELGQLRLDLWNSKSEKEFKSKAKKLVKEFIDLINPNEKNVFLKKQLKILIGAPLSIAMVERFVDILTNSNIDWRITSASALATILINIGFNASETNNLVKKATNTANMVKYSVSNFYGGGSDTKKSISNRLAWSTQAVGNLYKEIDPIAILTSDDVTNKDYLVNSIFIGVNNELY